MSTDPLSAAFAENLRRVREERKLPMYELAAMAGISASTLSLINNGAGTTLATLYRVAKALELDPRDMITEAGEEAPGA